MTHHLRCNVPHVVSPLEEYLVWSCGQRVPSCGMLEIRKNDLDFHVHQMATVGIRLDRFGPNWRIAQLAPKLGQVGPPLRTAQGDRWPNPEPIIFGTQCDTENLRFVKSQFLSFFGLMRVARMIVLHVASKSQSLGAKCRAALRKSTCSFRTVKTNWWERVKGAEIGATQVGICRGKGPCEFGERIPFVLVAFPVSLVKFLSSYQKHQPSQHVGHPFSCYIPTRAEGLGTQPNPRNKNVINHKKVIGTIGDR